MRLESRPGAATRDSQKGNTITPTPTNHYEHLKAEVQHLQRLGKFGIVPNDEQRVDWAYGTTKLENDDVTREMAEDAVRRHPTRPA